MKIRDFFNKFVKPKSKGSYIGGHNLGEGPEHPLWVNGIIANVESATFASEVTVLNTSLDVNLQDQTSTTVDFRFMNVQGQFNLSSGVNIDDEIFTAQNGHGISNGDILCFKEVSRAFQAIVTNVSSNLITIDAPFDYAFTVSAVCHRGKEHMNVDGSSNPVIFRVSPMNMSNSVSWDITSVLIHIEDNNQMDDTKFGGITALSRGVLLRVVDGETKNILVARDNGHFMDFCQEVQYNEKGSGGYGLKALKVFGGQQNSGVVIRLHAQTQDELQIIIRDNLTGLTDMHATAIGHTVV